MAETDNPIEQILDVETREQPPAEDAGPIREMLATYHAATSDRLLGFLLDLNYDELSFVTCDAWKQKCGGLPKNSLVIAVLNPAAADQRQVGTQQFLILARGPG